MLRESVVLESKEWTRVVKSSRMSKRGVGGSGNGYIEFEIQIINLDDAFKPLFFIQDVGQWKAIKM